MCLRIITDTLICLSHACYHRFSDLSLCLTPKRPSQQRCVHVITDSLICMCLTQKRPSQQKCVHVITDSLICLCITHVITDSLVCLCLTQKRPSQQRCARCVVTGRQASTMGWSAATGVGDSSNVPFARNRSRCTCAKTTIPASSTSTAATSVRPAASANVWP